MTKIGGNATGKRRGGDWYPTAPGHTRAVLPWLPAGLLWEPAAGDGAMLDVLAETHQVYGTDIEPQRADIATANFLESDPRPGTAGVVTNPPYSLAMEFVERAIGFDLPVALLLPTQYLGGKDRHARLFSVNPPSDVVVVSSRMHIPGVGSSQFNHAWYVWDRYCSDTRLHWVLG